VGSIPAFVAILGDPDRMLAFEPVQQIAERFGLQTQQQLVVGFAMAMGAFFIAKNAYLALLRYVQARYTFRRGVTIGSRLFNAYLHSPYTFHLQRNTAEILRNVNRESRRVVESVLIPVVNLLMESLVLLGLFLLLLIAEPVVSVVAFGTLGAVSGGFYLFLRGRLSDRGMKSQGMHGRMIQAVDEALGDIKLTKLRGREAHFRERYDREALGYADVAVFRVVSADVPRLSIETTTVLALVIVSITFVGQGRSLNSILPVLTLFAAAAVRLVPSFNRISMALGEIRFGHSAVDVVHTDLVSLEAEAEEDTAGTVTPMEFRSTLEARGLCYRYPDAPEDTLVDISVRIQRGTAVAFVGSSGAGKTTAVNALMGLLKPTAGGVFVDGVDIQTNLRGWQRQIGYIPQDVFLIDNTIRRNIAFGTADEDIDEAAVDRAVRAAQLEPLISRLPAGLDTPVGQRGIRLSGGQRQRVSIARALYHDPEVLVLDEATSDLDSETERYIMEAVDLLRGDRTLIVIAHRLSTVRNCDCLFLLEQGSLEATGTYDELLDSSERFRAIAQVQEV
jgi:ATP-binding cassette subfamily C protein